MTTNFTSVFNTLRCILKKQLCYILLALAVIPAVKAFAITVPVKNVKIGLSASTVISFAPAGGAIGTVVTIKGNGLSNVTSLVIGGKAAIIISASDTTVAGMVMPGAVTGAVTLNAGGILTAPGDFTVKQTPYPLAENGDKLADVNQDNGHYKTHQGTAVAVSADGSTAAVTSLGADVAQTGVKFFKKVNGAWVAASAFIRPGPPTPGFGATVSLSGDGTYAVIGSLVPGSVPGVPVSGDAYVFKRSAGFWSNTSAVKLSGKATSVSISADGNAIVAGKIAYVTQSSGKGTTSEVVNDAAYVYQRSGANAWALQYTFAVPSGNAPPGSNVTISADAKTVVLASRGKSSANLSAFYPPYISILSRSSSTANDWAQLLQLPGNYQSFFAVSADGGVVIANASLYTRENGSYIFLQDIYDGSPVALSADGKTILYSNNGPFAYTLDGDHYVLKAPQGDTYAGASIAMSANAGDAFLGVPTDNTTVTDLGSARAYKAGPELAFSKITPNTGASGTVAVITGLGTDQLTDVKVGGKSAIIVSKTITTATIIIPPGALTGALSLISPDATIAGNNFTVTPTLFPRSQGPKIADTARVLVHDYSNPATLSYNLGQGQSVALSADGNTALVGVSTGYIQQALPHRSVTEYKRMNGLWQKAGVVATYPDGGSFGPGYAIKVNADATVAVLVNSEFNGPANADIYIKKAGSWSFAQSLPGNALDITISADGNTIGMGSSMPDENQSTVTTIRLFTRQNDTWLQQPSLPSIDNYASRIPGNLAVSADGKTLAVTISRSPGAAHHSTLDDGIALIYIRSGAEWKLQQSIQHAGSGLHLSADGNVLATQYTGTGTDIYTRTGSTWAAAQTIPETTPVSISADAGTIVFSGLSVYSRNANGGWIKQAAILPAHAGSSIALSADGATALLGNPLDDTTVPNQPNTAGSGSLGAIYAYGAEQAVVTPSGYATALNFANTTGNSTTLSWTKGNGGLRAVFIGIKGSVPPLPADYATYSANATFGSGAQLVASGWYCVYNGSGSLVDITNLSAATTYRAEVIEYNGNPGNERYNISRFAPADVTTLKVAPTVQSSGVAFAATTGVTTTVSWTNGNGAGRAVFISNSATGAPLPSDVYYSSNAKFAGGNQIGSTGWYCVYNGTGSAANITNLTSGGTYRVAVVEYSGTSTSPRFLTTGIAPANVTTAIAPPAGYAVSLAFSNVTPNSATLSWTSGNGAARVVFIEVNGSNAFAPVNNTTYAANNTFGLGSAINTVWYCVYNGTGNSVNIFGLSPSTQYRATVVDYNGTTGAEAYGTRYNAVNVTTLQNVSIMSARNQSLTLDNKFDQQLVANNILSPNGDGRNDTWMISNIELHPDATVTVTDAGGNIVFSKKGYTNDWAGSYRGGTVAEGTYYYTIDPGDSTVPLKGFITVVRDR